MVRKCDYVHMSPNYGNKQASGYIARQMEAANAVHSLKSLTLYRRLEPNSLKSLEVLAKALGRHGAWLKKGPLPKEDLLTRIVKVLGSDERKVRQRLSPKLL
jgi:hypothetical protein